MTTQKEKIQTIIDSLTEKRILDGSYYFGDLNANNLSIDLQMDRSNVSRILNSLYQEKKLIKQKGRPTLYLSKKAFVKQYPYLTLPNLLEIGDKIQNHLNISNYTLTAASSTHADSFHDISHDEILYPLFKSLFPIFFYPNKEISCIILTGARGSGKKHLLNLTINKAKQAGIISFSSEILYYTHFNQSDNYQIFLDFLTNSINQNTSAICIETLSVEHDALLRYLQIINLFYKNHQLVPPIIVFSIHCEQSDWQILQQITPFTLYLPLLKDRPMTNKIYTVLTILQSESDRLKQIIDLSKEVLYNFVTTLYPYQVQSLKNDILYALAQTLTNCKNNQSNINLTDYFLNTNQAPNSFQFKEDLIWKNLPNTITLIPNQPMKLEKLLHKEKDSSHTRQNKQTLEKLLCQVPVLINPIQKSKQKEAEKIDLILKETPLKHDPSLLMYLTDIFIQIKKGNNSLIEQVSYKIKYQSDSLEELTFKRILRVLDMYHISDDLQQFMRALIYTSFDMVLEANIPVLITSQSYLADYNFALYGNMQTGKRLFMTLTPTDIFYQIDKETNQRVKNISKKMSIINRGNGTLLINDFDAKSSQNRTLLLELRSLSFSIRFPSVETLSCVAEITNKTDKNIVSLSPLLIQERKKNKLFFQSNTLMHSNERQKLFIQTSKNIFHHTNVPIMTEIFFQILQEIAHKFDLELTNSLILDFIFMGNCIINNRELSLSHDLKTLDTSNKYVNNKLFRVLVNKIRQQPTLKTLQLNISDIECLYIVLYNHLHQ